jgi:hypothetical protein
MAASVGELMDVRGINGILLRCVQTQGGMAGPFVIRISSARRRFIGLTARDIFTEMEGVRPGLHPR